MARVLLAVMLVATLTFAGCAQQESIEQGSSSGRTGTVPTTADTGAADINLDALVEVPNPLDGDNPVFDEKPMKPPKPGEAVEFEGLGTSFVRVTEQPRMRHEYARFDPFNADKSMIVLFNDGWFVYRTEIPYNAEENLVRAIEVEEARWDRTDPARLVGLRDFSIISINVETGEEEVLKDFAEDPTIGPLIKKERDLYRVTTKDEGETSYDGRYWALALQGMEQDYRLRYIFCWDSVEDEVLGTYALKREHAEMDWVGMSPKGEWMLIASDTGNGKPFDGFVIADKNLTEFHQLEIATGHSDVGLDTSGNEVIVMQNARTDYVDLIPLRPDVKPVDSPEAYEGSGHQKIVRLFYANESPYGFNSSVHISCNANGYALISTYQDPGMGAKNWLDRSIVLVRLDPDAAKVYQVAKIHNSTADFWEETHGAISNDGAVVVWSANFDVDPGSRETHLLRVDLPR